MTDVVLLLPPVTAYDQFFLRQKAKRVAIIQFFTDLFFLVLVIHYYTRFVLPNTCPADTVDCTHFGGDFTVIKNGLSGEDKALITAAVSVFIKVGLIVKSCRSMDVFDGFTRESDLNAAKLTRNLYLIRVFTSIGEVLMHLGGGISLKPTTLIVIVRLVFFIYPLFQLGYVLNSIWSYFIVMTSMTQCMQGSYEEEEFEMEVIRVIPVEIIV